MTSQPPRARERMQTPDVLLGVLLALIALAVFGRVLGHHFLECWDDGGSIVWNPAYNPPRPANLLNFWLHPPRQRFYVPITYTIWGLVALGARRPGVGGEWATFNPAPFHALNLVAHILSAVLVFVILRRLVRSRWPAWLGALLFALHPIQVESVAWAATMYTPLSGMLCLWAIWQYLLYSDAREAGHRGAAKHYILATIGFVLALLTKPAVV